MECFRKKSRLVKCLIILLVLLVIVLVALFVNLVIRKVDHSCKTENCIKSSAESLRYMDQSANPCDDFHAFTCGNFARNRKDPPLPEPLEELSAMIADLVKPHDPKPFKMQKMFYQSCLNLEQIQIDQEETILEMFRALGQWPVLLGSNWNGTYFNWVELVKNCRRLGLKIDYFLDFDVWEDNFTRTNMLKIDVPDSLKPLTKNEQTLRKVLLNDIVVYMGADPKLSAYETSTIIDFEDDLGKVADKHRIRARAWTSPPTRIAIHELTRIWPSIRWQELIGVITGNRLMGNDVVIFNALDYLKDLNQLIMGTPKRIVADYIMWKIVEEVWPFLSQQIRTEFQKYQDSLSQNYRHHHTKYNQDELANLEENSRERHLLLNNPHNRHSFCINASRTQFPLVAESVFIRKHVTEQKRLLVRDIIFVIRKTFVKSLEDAHWMNRQTRRRTLRKILELKFIIGGPQDVYDQFRFTENLGLYGFAFNSINIIDMLCDRKKQHYNSHFGHLSQRVWNQSLDLYEKSINITHFKIINENTIVVPAALLRDQDFSTLLPNYLNYATVGKAIAHQIFEYIYKGNETEFFYFSSTNLPSSDSWYRNSFNKPQTLWSEDTFDDAIKCLVKESPNYPLSEMMRPKRLKENLADFVALDIAYESYYEWSRLQPQEVTLPGLKYSPTQLFWIHTNKELCAKSNVLYNTKQDRDNARFGIIGPTRNSKYFAKEFECPSGSKMNPRRKCKIL